MTYLSVKNLEKHQHYKDRRPPWIKLHSEVLDDYTFACLQDASKAHLMLIWVLASRMDNRIPNDPVWIGRKINSTCAVDVASLVSAGFLAVYDADGNLASKALASSKQSALVETETETETETQSNIGVSGDTPTEVDGSPVGFAACWEAYPKRPNAAKKKAVKAYQARLRAGVSPDDLLSAVNRYAAYCDRTGKTGTEFTQQPATFFGPNEQYLLDWTDGTSRDVDAGLLTIPADALLAILDSAGLGTFGGNRQSYYRLVDKMADTLEQPHDKFRAFVMELKPWDLPGSFRPDRVRMLDGRLAAARQALA